VHGTLHKLAAWLVLVAYGLSGVSPAHALVLCLEPDGSVALEAAAPAGCTPCGGEQGSGRDVERAGADCCPCVDIPLPTQAEESQARPRTCDGAAVAAVAHPPVLRADVPTAEPAALARPAHAAPRPAPGLALIRTVVLRV
jgi:hypothetical protein